MTALKVISQRRALRCPWGEEMTALKVISQRRARRCPRGEPMTALKVEISRWGLCRLATYRTGDRQLSIIICMKVLTTRTHSKIASPVIYCASLRREYSSTVAVERKSRPSRTYDVRSRERPGRLTPRDLASALVFEFKDATESEAIVDCEIGARYHMDDARKRSRRSLRLM